MCISIHTYRSACSWAVLALPSAPCKFSIPKKQKRQNCFKKRNKKKKPRRFLQALGTAYQKQTCIMQQAGGRQSISSEAQRSTAKRSQA